MYRFVDLFCGIGGFRVALEKRGLDCVFSSDIDPKVRQAYRDNFGDLPEGDITEIPESAIPAHDVLCAGFPCQAFSIAGDKGGLDDQRGRLFYEIVRIAKYHRPYVLLLENVKNLLTVDGGEVIKTIEAKLGEIGYRVSYSPLNASYYGIPQHRERVYFACVRTDLKPSERLTYKEPKKTSKAIYLDDILEPEVADDLYITRPYSLREGVDTSPALKPIRIGQVDSGMQGHRIYATSGHAITLTANGGGLAGRTGLYLVNGRPRKLSQTECKRVMSFPDGHIVSEGIQGFKQLGNAIMPSMVGLMYDSVHIGV